MASYIKKTICNKELYYKSNNQWTEFFDDRKVFNTDADAREEQTRYSGVIITE